MTHLSLKSIAFMLVTLLCHAQASALGVGDRVQYYTTSTESLHVRQCASTNDNTCKVIKSIPPNSYGNVTAGPTKADGYTWYRITWDGGVSGYSVDNWLRATFADGNFFSTNDRIIVNGTSKNIRKCPDTSCEILGTVSDKSTGTILSSATLSGAFYWYKVAWDTGPVGYSSSGYFEYSNTPAPSGTGSGTGSGPGTGNPGSPGSGGTGSPTGPDLGAVAFKNTQLHVGDTLSLTGVISYPKGLMSLMVVVPDTTGNRSPLYVQLNGATTVQLDSSAFSMPIVAGDFPETGSYELVIDVLASDGINPKKSIVVTILPGSASTGTGNGTGTGTDKTAPTLTGAALPTTSTVSKSITMAGVAADNFGLRYVNVLVKPPSGTSSSINLSMTSGSTSVDLSGFTYVPTQTGTYRFTVTATDIAGNTAVRDLTVSVKPDNSAAIKALQDQKDALQSKLDAQKLERTAISNAILSLQSSQRTLLSSTQVAQSTLSIAASNGPFSYAGDATLIARDPVPALPQCEPFKLDDTFFGMMYRCLPAAYGTDQYKRYPFTIYVTYGARSPGNNFPAIVQGEYWNAPLSGCAGKVCGTEVRRTGRYLVANATQLTRQMTFLQTQMQKAIDGDPWYIGDASFAASDVVASALANVQIWYDEQYGIYENVLLDYGISPEQVTATSIDAGLMLLDLVPIVSSGLSLGSLIQGNDIVTGDPITWWAATGNIALGFFPEEKAAKRFNSIAARVPEVKLAAKDAKTLFANISIYQKKHKYVQTKVAIPLLESRFGKGLIDVSESGAANFKYTDTAGKSITRRLDGITKSGREGFEFKNGYVDCKGRVNVEIDGDIARLCQSSAVTGGAAPGSMSQIIWQSYESTNNPKTRPKIGFAACVVKRFQDGISACLKAGKWDDYIKFEEIRCGTAAFDCAPLYGIN